MFDYICECVHNVQIYMHVCACMNTWTTCPYISYWWYLYLTCSLYHCTLIYWCLCWFHLCAATLHASVINICTFNRLNFTPNKSSAFLDGFAKLHACAIWMNLARIHALWTWYGWAYAELCSLFLCSRASKGVPYTIMPIFFDACIGQSNFINPNHIPIPR